MREVKNDIFLSVSFLRKNTVMTTTTTMT